MKKTRLLIFLSIMAFVIMSFAACNNLPKLDKPEGLMVDEGVTRLSWTLVDGALSYNIEIYQYIDGKWEFKDERMSSSNSFRITDLQLESNRNYRFRVNAVGSKNLNRPSEWSEPIEAFKPYENGMLFDSINENTEYSLRDLGSAQPDENGVLEIPDTYRNKPVTQIGERAIYRKEKVKKIVVPDTVKVIGKEAFRDCKNLTEVDLPDGITTMGSYVFYGCSALKSIKIPNSLITIPQACFNNCTNLVDVQFGSDCKVQIIENYAFSSCFKLNEDTGAMQPVEIELPNSLKSIGKYAFAYSEGLSRIKFGANLEYIDDQAFVEIKNLKTLEFGNSLLSIGTYAFGNCENLNNVVVPNSVTVLGTGAFYGCSNLNNITLGDGLRTVGSNAFYGTPLCPVPDENDENYTNYDTSDAYYVDGWLVGLPYNKYAPEPIYEYDDKGNIKKDENDLPVILGFKEPPFELNVKPGTVGIAELSFYWYPEIKEAIEGGEKRIDGAGYCGLTRLTLPDSLKYINSGAFRLCRYLQEVHIGTGLISIDSGAFEMCPMLNKLEIDSKNNNLTTIGDHAFNAMPRGVDKPFSAYYKDLIKIDTEDPNDSEYASDLGKPYPGESAEYHDIALPNSLTEVGAYAFYHSYFDYYFKKHGTDNVVYVGGWAVGCPNEGSEFINVSNTQPNGKSVVGVANYAFVDLYSLVTARLPKSEDFKYLGAGAFSGCQELNNVQIPEGITRIYPSTFYGCTMLQKVGLPSTLETIDEYAFYNCGRDLANAENGSGNENNFMEIGLVKEVENDESDTGFSIKSGDLSSLISIGDFAFYNCNLRKVYFSDNLTELGAQAFCKSGLQSVSLPGSLREIKQFAFSNCTNLGEVTIEDGITSIGMFAFRNCNILGEVTIPESVKTIGESAFRGCESLVTVRLSEGLESIGDYAFFGCAFIGDGGLEAFILPQSLEVIGNYAFRGCISLGSIILGDNITKMGAHVFNKCDKLVIYTDMTTIPETWDAKWNSSFRPVLKGCTLSADKDYVVSFVKDKTTLDNYFIYYLGREGDYDVEGDEIVWLLSKPIRSSYVFEGWRDNDGKIYAANELDTVPDGTLLTAMYEFN